MIELRSKRRDEEKPKISSSKKLPLLQGLEGQREKEVLLSSRGLRLDTPSEAGTTQADKTGAEFSKRLAS